MSAPIGYGIDLSHFQNPDTLPWEEFRGKVQIVMARASYGAGLHDDFEPRHIAHARAIGAKVGVYHFYRPSQPVAAQFDALRMGADAAGITIGDVVPAIDVEMDLFPAPGAAVAPSWSDPCDEFAEKIISEYGNCIIYQTKNDWLLMGKPAWVLHRPLWVAEYTAGALSTPGGMPAFMHQHRVGKFDPSGPGGYFKNDAQQIDQNQLLAPPPLVGGVITPEDAAKVAAMVAESLAEIAAEMPTDPAPPGDV